MKQKKSHHIKFLLWQASTWAPICSFFQNLPWAGTALGTSSAESEVGPAASPVQPSLEHSSEPAACSPLHTVANGRPLRSRLPAHEDGKPIKIELKRPPSDLPATCQGAAKGDPDAEMQEADASEPDVPAIGPSKIDPGHLLALTPPRDGVPQPLVSSLQEHTLDLAPLTIRASPSAVGAGAPCGEASAADARFVAPSSPSTSAAASPRCDMLSADAEGAALPAPTGPAADSLHSEPLAAEESAAALPTQNAPAAEPPVALDSVSAAPDKDESCEMEVFCTPPTTASHASVVAGFCSLESTEDAESLLASEHSCCSSEQASEASPEVLPPDGAECGSGQTEAAPLARAEGEPVAEGGPPEGLPDGSHPEKVLPREDIPPSPVRKVSFEGAPRSLRLQGYRLAARQCCAGSRAGCRSGGQHPSSHCGGRRRPPAPAPARRTCLGAGGAPGSTGPPPHATAGGGPSSRPPPFGFRILPSRCRQEAQKSRLAHLRSPLPVPALWRDSFWLGRKPSMRSARSPGSRRSSWRMPGAKPQGVLTGAVAARPRSVALTRSRGRVWRLTL